MNINHDYKFSQLRVNDANEFSHLLLCKHFQKNLYLSQFQIKTQELENP